MCVWSLGSLFFQSQSDEKRDHVEICPQAGVIMEEISSRIEADGGMSLVIDYGHDGTKTDTIRVCFRFIVGASG